MMMITYLFVAVSLCVIHSNALSMTPTDNKASFRLSLGGETLRNLVQEAARSSSLDLEGILWLEHVNLVVGSKEIAEYFYIDILGFTRDAGKSFHVNLGQQQFHLAETEDPPQRIAGSMGLVVPSLETVRKRLMDAQEKLKDTQFSILSDDISGKCISLTCPWGNLIHLYGVADDETDSSSESRQKMVNLHAEGGAYGAHRMAIRGNPGIRFLEIACPTDKAGAIAKFYRDVMGCTVLEVSPDEADNTRKIMAIVSVGPGVNLVFVENDELTLQDSAAMEGIHICIYVQTFQALYNRLSKLNLIWTNPRFLHLDSCDSWEEAAQSRTLRFKHVIDLETGEKLLELEHETRPLQHGQYLKVPLYHPR